MISSSNEPFYYTGPVFFWPKVLSDEEYNSLRFAINGSIPLIKSRKARHLKKFARKHKLTFCNRKQLISLMHCARRIKQKVKLV